MHFADKNMRNIKKHAESQNVGNYAIMGLKGVGKTSLINAYFTVDKKKELAEKYKNIFVYTQLDDGKYKNDLYQFLIDIVKQGISVILNEEIVNKINGEVDEINKNCETLNQKLINNLSVIKDNGYKMIMILDHFHCMTRDKNVVKEQFELLRSYNQSSLLSYWVITDTHLEETMATDGFKTSFFVQNFTNKMTLKAMDKNTGMEAIDSFLAIKKKLLRESEKQMIYRLSGGIPQFMSMLIDELMNYRSIDSTTTGSQLEEEFIEMCLESRACLSIIDSWLSGLNKKQKRILYDIAVLNRDNPYGELPPTAKKILLADLSDEVGRGLLHVEREDGESIWFISVPILAEYILSYGEDFYEEPIPPQTVSSFNTYYDPVPTAATVTNITNIYNNVAGNYIETQNNTVNMINVNAAVESLVDLKRMLTEYSFNFLDQEAKSRAISSKLDTVAIDKNPEWDNLNDEERDEYANEYADKIFESGEFSGGLTDEQLTRFSLSNEVLSKLPDVCRQQISCGIQVYDILERCSIYCGLDTSVTESPRGILFGRAYETLLIKIAGPLYKKIPDYANEICAHGKTFGQLVDENRTSAGLYLNMLAPKKYKQLIVDLIDDKLGKPQYNTNWWKDYVENGKRVTQLRNNCCHFGNEFKKSDLDEMINILFHNKLFEESLIFAELDKQI